MKSMSQCRCIPLKSSTHLKNERVAASSPLLWHIKQNYGIMGKPNNDFSRQQIFNSMLIFPKSNKPSKNGIHPRPSRLWVNTDKTLISKIIFQNTEGGAKTAWNVVLYFTFWQSFTMDFKPSVSAFFGHFSLTVGLISTTLWHNKFWRPT